MHLGMVIDEQRLAREQRMLNRLGVGLMAEGVHLTRIVPDGLSGGAANELERRMGLAPRIEAPMKSLPWMRGVHVRQVIERIGDDVPDVFYLVGGNAWRLGLDLAQVLDRPALLEVCSAAQAAALPRITAETPIAGVVAPCRGIAEALRGRLETGMVHVAPMGVAVARRPRRPLADADRPPAVAVLGGARDVHAYASMLGGVARALKQQPALQVFLELHGPHEHDIWRAAERLGLLGATSAIGPAAQHRSLLLRCDVILWPERFGELRSILLEAMAMALPVVAAADAPLDMLIDGQTARLVGAPFSDVAWEQSLASVLTDVTSAQAMGMRAREHVIANHRSTAHVEALMQTLAQVGGQDAYAFPRPSD